MSQYRIVKAESAFDLIEHGLLTLDVQQNVVSLMNLGDWVGQLTATPVLPWQEPVRSGPDGPETRFRNVSLYPLTDCSHPAIRCGKRLRPRGRPALFDGDAHPTA